MTLTGWRLLGVILALGSAAALGFQNIGRLDREMFEAVFEKALKR